jgi:hypothetical protein
MQAGKEPPMRKEVPDPDVELRSMSDSDDGIGMAIVSGDLLATMAMEAKAAIIFDIKGMDCAGGPSA